jgi:hypothetical protein
MAKLLHGLVNTNRQNHLFYGTSSHCPICKSSEETLRHVFTCSHPTSVANRQTRLEELCKDLETAKTPPPIIQAIKHGFIQWSSSPDSTETRSLTAGSLRGPDAVVTTASLEQVRTIGWYHLCLGRVSKKWAMAAQQYDSALTRDGGLQWVSVFIAAILCYSRMLWRFRNGVVHGDTVEEQVALQLSSLHSKIRSYYQAYSENSNMVLARHQILFTSRTVEERVSGTYDTMAAWLRSMDKAVMLLQRQVAAHRAASEAFFPNRHSFLETDDTDSTYTDSGPSTTSTISLASTELTLATTTTMLSGASSSGILVEEISKDDDDTSSIDYTIDDTSFNSSVASPDTYLHHRSSIASDVEHTSVASLAFGSEHRSEEDLLPTEVYSINTHSNSTCTLQSPLYNTLSHNSNERTNELLFHQPLASLFVPTPTSFPVSDAATTSGPFNSLLCGLHPLEHGLPNSEVEFNSIASLGQVIPEANIRIDTGPVDVESSSVASQDTGPSGSNFSDAPSFSSQWADT